jgi:hypothetical protein
LTGKRPRVIRHVRTVVWAGFAAGIAAIPVLTLQGRFRLAARWLGAAT